MNAFDDVKINPSLLPPFLLMRLCRNPINFYDARTSRNPTAKGDSHLPLPSPSASDKAVR